MIVFDHDSERNCVVLLALRAGHAETNCHPVSATASGDSMGYNAGEAGIRFVYAPELRGPGFDPPPSVIPLSYEENWAGLVALLNEADSIANGKAHN